MGRVLNNNIPHFPDSKKICSSTQTQRVLQKSNTHPHRRPQAPPAMLYNGFVPDKKKSMQF
jgi:hypothetical protein